MIKVTLENSMNGDRRELASFKYVELIHESLRTEGGVEIAEFDHANTRYWVLFEDDSVWTDIIIESVGVE